MRVIQLSIYSVTFFLFSCSSSEKVKHESNSLVGSWKLLADQVVDSLGNVVLQDTAVSGLIIYTPEGKMSVQWLWSGLRKPIMHDTIMNQDEISYSTGLGKNTWTTEQARTIIDTYDAYFGDYSIDWENQVVMHMITANLRPEKIGKIYYRKFQLKGDTLFLQDTNPEMNWQAAWIRIRK